MAVPGTIQEGPYITLVAAEALGAGARVKLDSNGKAAIAGVGDPAIGFVTENAVASGGSARIAAITMPAMVYTLAHAAVEVGDLAYSQASGRLDDNDDSPSYIAGYFMDVATAQDQIVRVVRCESWKTATA